MSLSNTRYSVHLARRIGAGSYSSVHGADDRQSPALSLVAKVISMRHPQTHASWETERNVFAVLSASAQHPHIIRCMDWYTMHGYGVFILERFRCHTLEQHIDQYGSLSVNETTLILGQIVSAVQWLHERCIAVCDIKPENIAYDAATRTCTLFDFGLASTVTVRGERTSIIRGTPLYMAPELLRAVRHDPMRADYWALGQTVFEMLTGRRMFADCTYIEELRNHVYACASDGHIGRYTTCLPARTQELVQGLCAYVPEKRWDLDQVVTWFAAEETGGKDECVL